MTFNTPKEKAARYSSGLIRTVDLLLRRRTSGAEVKKELKDVAGILMDMPQCAEELAGALRDSQGQLTALNAQLPGGFLRFSGCESNCCAEALWPRHFRGAHPDLRRHRCGRNLADFLPSVFDIHILARLRLTSCASSRGRARAFLRSSRSGRVGPGRFLHS